jgi:hypothetical protein
MTKRQEAIPDLLIRSETSPRFRGWKTAYSATSRGRAFLVAYDHATSQDDEAEGLSNIDYLPIAPEEFEQFQRQASLAALSVGDVKDFPGAEYGE